MSTMKTLHELLTAALPYVEDVTYGTFPGGDPRMFTPDSIEDGTTEEEMARWKADCAAAEQGQVRQDPAGRWIVLGGGAAVHILQGKYGLGACRYRDEKAVALRDEIRTALAAVNKLGGEIPEGT